METYASTTYFKNYPYYGGTVSEELFNTGLCLPSGSNLSREDLERVALAIKIVVNKE